MSRDMIDCLIDAVDPFYNPDADDPIAEYEVRGRFSNVSCKEKGRSYILKFPDASTYSCKVHIDGGIVKDDSVRCDYGILTEDGIGVLVELKGKKIDHAFDQLTETAGILSTAKFKSRFKHVYGRIVGTACPNNASPHSVSCKEAFARLGGNVRVAENKCSEPYKSLRK